MKIKFKILAGFIVIVVMLVVAGAMSVYEFRLLSNSINAVVSDNYKSIEASKDMMVSLERQDSGVLLYLSGDSLAGLEKIHSADIVFKKAMGIAKNNVTEQGEDSIIKNLESYYAVYCNKWNNALVLDSSHCKMENYKSDFYQTFIEVKKEINALLAINQQSMYNKASLLEEKARRVLMPGILAIITALVFFVIFNFFVTRFFVSPLKNLIIAVKNYCSTGKKEFSADIDSDDEIKELETEISNLIARIRNSERK